MIRTLLSILLISWTTNVYSENLTTGNLLPNAGDGVDWGSSSTEMINDGGSGYVSSGDTFNGFTVTCDSSQANCGYKYDVGGDFEVTGTATISVDDISLTNESRTQSMLDQGITLNNYIDIANCESSSGNCESKYGSDDSHSITVELENSDGTTLSTVTQTRTNLVGFQGNCSGYPTYSGSDGRATGCGQYNDTIIYNSTGANKVDWSWGGTDSRYGNGSTASLGGPNLLGAKMTMTYDGTTYDPLDNTTEESLYSIDDTLDESLSDFQEEEWFYEEDFTSSWDDEWVYEEEFGFEEEYSFEEDFGLEEEFTWEDDYYFEEEFTFDDFEDVSIEEFEFEEFEEQTFFDNFEFEEFEEVAMEDTAFEEEFEEPEFFEEMFEEEFEETFTDFIEETGMAEEFEQFLEEEGITQEEFFEEIVEEEFAEEIIEEEFVEEVIQEEPMIEEAPSEVVENEEAIEEPEEKIEETKEVAENETEDTTEQDEPSSEDSEDTEVQSEDSEKQEIVQSEENVIKEKGVTTSVEKLESELKKNLKKVAKHIALIAKKNTKNFTKEDIFFKNNNTLNAYLKTSFYKPKKIYEDVNLGLYNQLDLSAYSKDIYTKITLASYIENDPVEVHRKKLEEITRKKQKLIIELEALRNE